jgi:hypothetical protein
MGGVLWPFYERKGGTERLHVCVHMRRQWRRRPFIPGKKTTGRGRLSGPAKCRGLVAVGGSGPIGGERGVGRPGWKERRALAGRIRSQARIQKEILFEFQLIFEFGRTLENCTWRFRRNFDMGIFPKIFLAIQVF